MDDYSADSVLKGYKEGMGQFTEQLPDIGTGFHSFTESCFADGALDGKQKQLIALALSVYADDKTCMTFHAKGCVDAGCTEQEVLEACSIAAALGSGAVMSRTVTCLSGMFKQLHK
ncbi:alkylhydroperoxidase/carboxymuconolactone decarboxylase family protein [Lysinibacillus sphaericus]|nr:alkylhydroperoxidase/carboxymuconolactone decarboxylase family protein [Lysinibacillus sphaericus]